MVYFELVDDVALILGVWQSHCSLKPPTSEEVEENVIVVDLQAGRHRSFYSAIRIDLHRLVYFLDKK